MVVRFAPLSDESMREEGIKVIDGYSLPASRLDLAAGDGFHWQAPGYELLSEAIIDRIVPSLSGARVAPSLKPVEKLAGRLGGCAVDYSDRSMEYDRISALSPSFRARVMRKSSP